MIAKESIAQVEDLPENVKYIKTTEKQNSVAKEKIFQNLEQGKGGQLYDEVATCGPALWKYLETNRLSGGIITTSVDIQVPIEEKTKIKILTLHAKLIDDRASFNKFYNEIIRALGNKGKLNIRTLRKNEILYFWTIIPFDIEEPIFIVENQNMKFIFDLDKKNKISWIELVD